MARLKTGSVPGLRRHKPTGKAVVELSGQLFYLGPWGSKTALAAYDRAVSEWLARGRRPCCASQADDEWTVVELLAAYREHAEQYYVKEGRPTSEVQAFLALAKVVEPLYGELPVNEFSPLKLQAVQQRMIALQWARKTINRQCQRLVRVFRWAAAQELAQAATVQALREVPGLHKGRTAARETAPVPPVPDATVQATLPHLPPVIADMVAVQRLCGARPDEICRLRPADVDRSGSIWAYRPETHKNAHRGQRRVIFLGPKAQTILAKYMLRADHEYCFSPAESEQQRRALAHHRRRVPLTYGNTIGTNRKAAPQRPAGQRYTTASYRRAIERGCELAFGFPAELGKRRRDESPEQKAARLQLARQWREANCWSPNQLRHTCASEVRRRHGLEAAQHVLGHAHAQTTEIYAERDLEKAAAVMQAIG